MMSTFSSRWWMSITGSLNDEERGMIIRCTIEALTKPQIRWTAWTLQPHHGVFNDF